MAVPSGHCMVTTSLWVLVSWQQVHFRCMAWASMEYLQTRGTLSTRPGRPQPPGPGFSGVWSRQLTALEQPSACCLSTWGIAVLAWPALWALRTTLNTDFSWPGTLSSLNHPLNLMESADPSSRDLPRPFFLFWLRHTAGRNRADSGQDTLPAALSQESGPRNALILPNPQADTAPGPWTQVQDRRPRLCASASPILALRVRGGRRLSADGHGERGALLWSPQDGPRIGTRGAWVLTPCGWQLAPEEAPSGWAGLCGGGGAY